MAKKRVRKETKSMDNSFGVAGVVLGILSIAFLGAIGVILGIVGLIFSMKQKKITENKWSRSGMWVNIIGIVLGIIVSIFIASLLSNYGLGQI